LASRQHDDELVRRSPDVLVAGIPPCPITIVHGTSGAGWSTRSPIHPISRAGAVMRTQVKRLSGTHCVRLGLRRRTRAHSTTERTTEMIRPIGDSLAPT